MGVAFKMNKQIDFVVTWVDGDDPKWRQKHDEYLNIDSDGDHADSESRYRDFDTFKYWFRAVEKYAPWVNKIYLITDQQRPKWLASVPNLVVIDHADIIPSKFLPTFNSNVIESHIHRIPNLAEQFVLFNDDMFLNNSTQPNDFFKNGLPLDSLIFHPVFPEDWFDHIRINNLIKINQAFHNKRKLQFRNFSKVYNYRYGKYLFNNLLNSLYNRVPGFIDWHCSTAYLKSDFEYVVEKYSQEFTELSTHKVRLETDISHWLIRYSRLMEGRFYPQSPKFGKSIYVNRLDDVKRTLLKGEQKIININDVDDIENMESYQNNLISLFEKKFPAKSRFEI